MTEQQQKRKLAAGWKKTPEYRRASLQERRLKKVRSLKTEKAVKARVDTFFALQKANKTLQSARRYRGKKPKFAKEAKAKTAKAKVARQQARRDIEKLAGIKFLKP